MHRPAVWMVVVLSVFRGAFTLAQHLGGAGVSGLPFAAAISTRPAYTLNLLFALVLAGLFFASAWQVGRYRLSGLYLGLGLWGLDLLATLADLFTPWPGPGASDPLLVVAIAVDGTALYFVLRYLLRESEKAFFS